MLFGIIMIQRKIKLNKKFIPIICDEDDELFPNGIFEFNITKLIKFIGINQGEFQAQAVETRSLSIFNADRLDKESIFNADLSNPIILAEISPNTFNVIDGHHRLQSARHRGLDTILAYKIYAEQHINFLTSMKAYESYIDYWNEKLKRSKF